MSTLADLRTYVRTQTETTSAELPDSTIDNYLQEAFNRTIAAESQWPFLETSWTVTQAAGNSYAPKPSDLGFVSSMVDTDNYAYRMTMIDYDTAEDEYFRVSTTGGYAVEFSLWGDNIYFWPQVTFDSDRDYSLRGYRQPIDWLAVGDTEAPDCDERLHRPLAHYAIALAYAQQEDETLETTYMARWQADVEMARKIIMEPNSHRPLVMGPRRYPGIGRNRFRPSFTITAP
jgi:hypothetical protein